MNAGPKQLEISDEGVMNLPGCFSVAPAETKIETSDNRKRSRDPLRSSVLHSPNQEPPKHRLMDIFSVSVSCGSERVDAENHPAVLFQMAALSPLQNDMLDVEKLWRRRRRRR